MALRPTPTLLLVILSCALHGCADPCVEYCEASKSCPGKPATNCAESCDVSNELADLFGCREPLDAAGWCEADAADVCTARDACSAELEAFNACMVAACETNPSLCGEDDDDDGGGLGGALPDPD